MILKCNKLFHQIWLYMEIYLFFNYQNFSFIYKILDSYCHQPGFRSTACALSMPAEFLWNLPQLKTHRASPGILAHGEKYLREYLIWVATRISLVILNWLSKQTLIMTDMELYRQAGCKTIQILQALKNHL